MVSDRVEYGEEIILLRYVNRFHRRSKRTEWPSIRRCARSLRWTQARVEEVAESTHHFELLSRNFKNATSDTVFVAVIEQVNDGLS